jgi:hypothetical protein
MPTRTEVTNLGRFDDADPLLAELLAAEPDHKRGAVLRIRALARSSAWLL